jgi:hypothetical protein
MLCTFNIRQHADLSKEKEVLVFPAHTELPEPRYLYILASMNNRKVVL